MIGCMHRFHPFNCCIEIFYSVKVPVKAGKITAGYLSSDTVALFEYVTGCNKIDDVFIDSAGYNTGGVYRTITETGTDDAVA